MSDKTLSISAALREAQLQRLESSLASKAATKPKAKSVTSREEQRPTRD